jgi:general secretion pathway protein K
MKPHAANKSRSKEGAALLVALWVLIILSLIVGSFAFEIQLEAMLVSHKRKKFRAEMMAYSGLEYARAILDKRAEAKQLEIEDMAEDRDGFMQAALYIKRGLATSSEIELGDGRFTVTLESAESGRNINLLQRDDWLDLFEMANVPSTEWDAMIDCLEDWTDEGDLHKLNGAESDDPFYEERGYPVKNAPLDSVEELMLIKGWGPDILYGRAADDENEEIIGMAPLLTVWGDGRINLNTVGTDLLYSFPDITEEEVEHLLELRNGEDGEPGTTDDGLPSGFWSDDGRFKLQSDFVKVTSVGDIFGNQYQISCIFLLNEKDAVVVYWEEGPVKQDAYTR